MNQEPGKQNADEQNLTPETSSNEVKNEIKQASAKEMAVEAMNAPVPGAGRTSDSVETAQPFAPLNAELEAQRPETLPAAGAAGVNTSPAAENMEIAAGQAPSGRPMQEQPAIRLKPMTAAEAMRPEVPGETPVGVDGEDAEREMRRMSRRSFLWAGAIGIVGVAGWKIFTGNPLQDGILSPLRHALQFDESVSRSYFSPARLAPNFPVSMARDMKVNGTYGVEDDLDADAWRLKVQGAHGKAKPFELTLDDIKKLPRVEMVTEHKCIEGWSVIVHWAGARFADFAAKYMPPARNGGKPDVSRPGDLVRYVSMATPDGNYYVGLDMESALHPQTLLCYEMNGQPLPEEHGAPLRLVVPIKYGIKSIKRIGTIAYTDTRPADYWAEQGYDWYAGH